MQTERIYWEESHAASGERTFYEITTEATIVTIRYGRIGTQGVTQATIFDSNDEARRYAELKTSELQGQLNTSLSAQVPQHANKRTAPHPSVQIPGITAFNPHPALHEPPYGDFGKRAIATVIDWTLKGATWAAAGGAMTGVLGNNDQIWGITFFAVSAVYSVYFESSEYRATPGKRAMGLIVTDMDGKRLSIPKAFIRWFVRQIEYAVTGGLGVLVAAFTQRKQALHDIIVGTLVYSKAEFEQGSQVFAVFTEKAILQAAQRHGGILTPMVLTVETPISLDEANTELQRMANRGICRIEINDAGRIEYHFSDFLK